MAAVYRKEMRSYLISMIGYVFIAFMLVMISLYFAYLNLNLASPRFEAVLQSVQFIFLIFVPILTMRVLAEEKKQKTDQLLLTLPLTVSDIVLGKFLAVVTLFAVPMLIVCTYPLILSRYGMINMAVAYMSILSFFLLGCANIAIGVFCSSLTENPIIAAVTSFGTLMICFLMDNLSHMVPGTAKASLISFEVIVVLISAILYNLTKNSTVSLAVCAVGAAILFAVYFINPVLLEGLLQKVLSVFYMNGRLESFFEGVLDIRGIVYYLSITVVALFLSMQTLNKRRWS